MLEPWSGNVGQYNQKVAEKSKAGWKSAEAVCPCIRVFVPHFPSSLHAAVIPISSVWACVPGPRLSLTKLSEKSRVTPIKPDDVNMDQIRKLLTLLVLVWVVQLSANESSFSTETGEGLFAPLTPSLT